MALEADYRASIDNYTEPIKGIRVAIAIEMGLGADQSPPTPKTGTTSQQEGWLTGLSNKAGAQAVLEKVGEGMALVDLIAAMKEGGHPVAGNRALSVALSSNKEVFVSRDGKWFLKAPPLPSNSQPPATKDDLPDI